MSQTITIAGEMPSLNEVINMAKRHWSTYAKLKKSWTRLAWATAKQARLEPFVGRSQFLFLWYESSKRRDPDNICSVGRKFILDGFVMAGLMSDGWKGVAGFADEFLIDKERPRVVVAILPAGESIFHKVYGKGDDD